MGEELEFSHFRPASSADSHITNTHTHVWFYYDWVNGERHRERDGPRQREEKQKEVSMMSFPGQQGPLQ